VTYGRTGLIVRGASKSEGLTMGSLSIWHWLIVLAVVLVLFGGGSKISSLMGDFAKGIKSFKKNMGEDESMEATAHPTTGHPNGQIAPPVQGAYAPGQTAPQAPAAHPERVGG